MKTLEQRVNKLEKETRWYRRATLVLGLMIVAGVTMGQAYPDIVDVLKCRKLEVHGASGQVAGMSATTEGGLLWISDASGDPTVFIANFQHGGGLTIRNVKGLQTAIIGNNEHGEQLMLGNGPSFMGVTISNTERGGQLSIGDASGKTTTFISNLEDGGGLSIYNKTGESVIELYADEYGNGVVGAFNRKGMGRTLQPGP